VAKNWLLISDDDDDDDAREGECRENARRRRSTGVGVSEGGGEVTQKEARESSASEARACLRDDRWVGSVCGWIVR
jgi:hypothetical protein